MGIDAIPLRTQPDRRLVRLVREGYESAFEEIVRRYRRPLDRFAASIVGGHSEDVTQDSFRKALEALRRDEGEIELRPWLYRIVRNTALNDLRDRPPAAAELAEDLLAGGRSAAVEAEQRAEVAALTAKLRALPENQRAALVMRELEGMGHEQIAAALGISGGAARQAIARARTALRGGLGALVPLPLLRALAGSGDAASEVASGVGAAGAGSVGIGGATLFGGGAALKVGLATVVVAGGIGAGVAIDHHRGAPVADPPPAAAESPAPTTGRGHPAADRVDPSPSLIVAERQSEDRLHGDRHRGSGSGHGHRSDDGREAEIEREAEVEHAAVAVPAVIDESAPKPGASSGGGPGPSRTGGGHGTSGHSDEDRSGDDGSGHGADDSGSGKEGSGGSGSDGGHSGSDGSGSGSGGHGSDDPTEATAEAPTAEAPAVETLSSESSSSGGSGPSSSTSSSGGDGSESSGGHGSDDDLEISP